MFCAFRKRSSSRLTFVLSVSAQPPYALSRLFRCDSVFRELSEQFKHLRIAYGLHVGCTNVLFFENVDRDNGSPSAWTRSITSFPAKPG